MYDKESEEKVWNGWTQMKHYLSRVVTVFAKAQERYYFDQKGKKYFDATANLLSSSLGHGISDIKESIVRQYERMDSCTLLCETSDISIQYTEALLERFHGQYNHIFYTNSGSEACDTVIKIAQQYFFNKGMKGKEKIITLEGCYHGSTVAAALISCNEYDKRALKWDGCPVLQVNPPRERDCPAQMSIDDWVAYALRDLEALIKEQGEMSIAAILVEPVQLSNAVAVIPDAYFNGIRILCDKYHILFIVDEVATGFGHTGKMFAFERWGVWPDLIMMAKAITNGTIPFGGVIVTNDVYHEFCGELDSGKELSHGYTTSGNPIGCAAACAVLKYMENHHILEYIEEQGPLFVKKLKRLEDFSFVESAEGIGFMFGIRFKPFKMSQYQNADVGAFLEGILKSKGLLVYYEGNSKMFLSPPLTTTEDELVFIIDTMYKAFQLVEGILD